MRKANQILGIGTLIFSVSMLWYIGKLPLESIIFPRTLLWIMVILGTILFFLNLKKGADRPVFGKIQIGSFLVAIIGTIIYIFMLPIVGFHLMTFLTLAILSWIFGGLKKDWKAIRNSVLFSGIFTAVLYIAFEYMMKVPLPKGILFQD